MYEKVNPNLDFVEREKEVIDFWKKNDVFHKSIEKTEGGEEFSFYDGPPTANGKPHIGHILTRVMKDIIPRYKTMKGYHVLRKAGWDTHGLPVELEVEKKLGMDGKQDIEKYGIEPFIKQCKESVWKYQHEWELMSDRVGYWVDMEHPYVTYDDNYIESVWWALKEIHKKGLIYKGHKIVPYCPRCGTALSSHEVAQGYKDVEETTAVAKFKVKNADNTFILAWTTTPWTLPSNVALCMHPDYEYSLIESEGVRYIMAKELIDNFFTDYTVIETKKGKDYEYLEYEGLFDYYKGEEKYHYVTNDTYVTLTDGTGVVHIAPAFGEDDANVGRKYGLPFVQLIDERGKFVKEAGEYAEVFCKDADKLILKDLSSRGLLFKTMKVMHSYPFCWRCDTPLLYYARSTWFIKVTAVKDLLIKNNASVNWMPDSIGKGRMGNFLENVVDWGLSRDRYWGTPLPIWVCPDCGEIKVIGSKAELIKEGNLSGDIELHKPYVDNVTIKCDKCGGKMKRTPEVIDCWFDSGSMPFAQYHYPFENKDLFEKTFPANFISEAVDQTRGWFYTLLTISTLLFNKAPFRNCIVLGHVGDKNGIKMSKHKGNVVDPWSVLDKQGADAVRWYFYTTSMPWLPSRFSAEAVSEAQRKYLGTLWNTYSFYVLYAEIDKFDPTKYDFDKVKFSVTDKWVLSELNKLVKTVNQMLDEYRITESARLIADFADEVSNWYIRLGRDRYWGSEMTDDKIAAYMTLNKVLVTLSKLTAPYTPFIAESIYQNVVRSVDSSAPVSVHLCEYPVADERFIDEKLSGGMKVAMNAAALGRAARSAANIKNRQPLSRVLLCGSKKLDDELLKVIADELNVKDIEFITDAGEFVTYEVKPQLKTLGPKYGKLINAIRAHLAANPEEVVTKVRKDGKYSFVADGTEIELTEDDLLIGVINRQGYASESNDGLTAILDTALTPELVREGLVRELVSKIQAMRKENGFEVTDKIKVWYYTESAQLKEILSSGAINKDVLAVSVAERKGGKLWSVNGIDVELDAEKA